MQTVNSIDEMKSVIRALKFRSSSEHTLGNGHERAWFLQPLIYKISQG